MENCDEMGHFGVCCNSCNSFFFCIRLCCTKKLHDLTFFLYPRIPQKKLHDSTPQKNYALGLCSQSAHMWAICVLILSPALKCWGPD